MGRSHTHSIVGGIRFEAVVVFFRKHIVPQKCSRCTTLRNQLVDESEKWSYDLEEPFSNRSRNQLDLDLCAWESPNETQFFRTDTSPKSKQRQKESRGSYGYRNVNITELRLEKQDPDNPVILKYSHDSSPYKHTTPDTTKASYKDLNLYKVTGKDLIDTAVTAADKSSDISDTKSFLPKLITPENRLLHRDQANLRLPCVKHSESSMESTIERCNKHYIHISTKHTLQQAHGKCHLTTHQSKKNIQRVTYKLTKLDTHDFCHYEDRRLHLQHYKFRKTQQHKRSCHGACVTGMGGDTSCSRTDFWQAYDAALSGEWRRAQSLPGRLEPPLVPRIDVARDSYLDITLRDLDRYEDKVTRSRQRTRRVRRVRRLPSRIEKPDPLLWDWKGNSSSERKDSGPPYEFASFKGRTVPKHFAENLNNLKVRIGNEVRSLYSNQHLQKKIRKRLSFSDKE